MFLSVEKGACENENGIAVAYGFSDGGGIGVPWSVVLFFRKECSAGWSRRLKAEAFGIAHWLVCQLVLYTEGD